MITQTSKAEQVTNKTQKYLNKTIREWLGIPNTSDVELPKMPDRLQRLFLRIEEYENSCRDQWGEWEHTYSENYQEGKLWIPEVDQWICTKIREIDWQNIQRNPMWPNGEKFAVQLSHDVDIVSDRLSLKQKLRKMKSVLNAEDLQNGKKQKFILFLKTILLEFGQKWEYLT